MDIMEFNEEVLQFIFIAVFIVGVVTLFHVKYLLKKVILNSIMKYLVTHY